MFFVSCSKCENHLKIKIYNIHWWMNEENVCVYIYIYNWMLVLLRKEGNPAIYRHMDEPGEHCAELNRANTAWIHLSEGSKIVKLIEAESRMVVARCWGRGKWVAVQRVESFSSIIWISSRDLLFLTVTMFSHRVLCPYTFVNEIDLILSVITIIKWDISQKKGKKKS